MCKGCTSCKNGRNGYNGLPGRDGRDGAKGDKGVAGPPGVKGDAGQNGADVDYRNWKQCAWTRGDSRDIGLIKVCINFKKQVFKCSIFLSVCSSKLMKIIIFKVSTSRT